MATNQGFKSLVPIDGQVEPAYLFHWLRTNRAYLESLGNGATFKEISKAVVSNVKIPLPTVNEQRQIAYVLDIASSIRSKRHEALVLLDKLAQSVFLEMFGDPGPESKFWQSAMIRTVAKVQIGPFGSLLHQKDYVADGTPLINPMHIIHGEIAPDPRHCVTKEKGAHMSLYQLRVGDVVLARRGEMGRCAVVREGHDGMICGTGSLIIRPSRHLLTGLYLSHVISHASMRKRLAEVALGITMPNLNRSIVENVRIPLPPLEMQHKFADRLEAIEALKKAQRAHLSHLDDLLSTLQYRAFRGEL
jgi:type I restriction enzyme S subunit